MTTAFSELKVSDARVTEVVMRGGEVLVRLRDWQEHPMAMTFEEVIGFAAFCAIDADLSHAMESTDDPLIQQSCRRANESLEGYRCFSLLSAWTGEPLLRIVARRVVVAETH